MKDRTTQDLLAERRANVLEAMAEPDKIARKMLLWHVAEIDRELERRRGGPLPGVRSLQVALRKAGVAPEVAQAAASAVARAGNPYERLHELVTRVSLPPTTSLRLLQQQALYPRPRATKP